MREKCWVCNNYSIMQLSIWPEDIQVYFTHCIYCGESLVGSYWGHKDHETVDLMIDQFYKDIDIAKKKKQQWDRSIRNMEKAWKNEDKKA